MLVNERDLGLAIGLISKTNLERYQLCFPIPDFVYEYGDYKYNPHLESLFCIFSNNHLLDDYCSFLQEYVFPNFVKWEKLKEPNVGDYYSDLFSVWFDVDSDMLLYWRLKNGV